MSNGQFREWCLQCVERHGLLDGKFDRVRRIDEEGGAGVFSLVFVGLDVRSGTDVALKFLDPMCRELYRRESFKREAKILQQLVGQPDIVELKSPISAFTENLMAAGVAASFNVPMQFEYYAVELAASDMGACIAGANWTPIQLLAAFRTMCRAVQRLHNQGISHRDLKPRNFLVMPDGTVKLSDFGTARHLNDREQLLPNYSGPPGDVTYTAPELCALLHDGDPSAAPAADVFGLGAILFELFTGVPLGDILYDKKFVQSLMTHMYAIPKANRRLVYDGFVSSLANAHPLPDLAAFGPLIPRSILDPLDTLYKSMAALDYRSRLCSFDRIFLKINMCLLILQNEARYKRWRAEKQRRRDARINKLGLVGERK